MADQVTRYCFHRIGTLAFAPVGVHQKPNPLLMKKSSPVTNRQFRKLTKTKGAFPNQDSLLKLLYMGSQNASRKWTMPTHNWSLTISQLAIFFFEGRLDKELKL